MKKSGLLVLGVTSLLIATSASLPAGAGETQQPAAPIKATMLKSAELTQSERLRAELGFAPLTDAATGLLSTSASGSEESPTTLDKWGFVGTAAEGREMDRREQVAKAAQDIRPTLEGEKGYAGLYIDNANGGQLVAAFADTLPASTRAKVEQAATLAKATVGSTAEPVEFRIVEHSSAELAGAITAAWAWSDGRADKPIGALSENVINNTVDVNLNNGAAKSDVEALFRALGIEANVSTVAGQDAVCTSRTACDSPRRAGVEIGTSAGVCSSGWIVLRNGVRGGLTAGHCWYGSNSGAVTSGGLTFGSKTTVNALTDGTHADMRYLSIPSNAQPWIYQNNTTTARVVSGTMFPTVGQVLCSFVRSSANPKCGTVSSTNAGHTSTTTGARVYGQIRASTSVVPGDSGGATASNGTGNVAVGTVSYGSTSFGHHSSVSYLATYGLGSVLRG